MIFGNHFQNPKATVLVCSLGFVYDVVGVSFDVSANCVVMNVAGVYS